MIGEAARAIRHNSEVLGSRLHICDDCGQWLRLPSPTPGMDCRCVRCDAVLRRDRQNPLTQPLALAAASLILCVITLTTPFLTIRLLGQERGSTVGTGAWAFLDDGLWTLSLLLLLTVMLVPLLHLALRLVVLGGLALPHPPRWLYRPLRWHEALRCWSMLEVFLLGVLVSTTQLMDLAELQLGPAIYGLGAVVLAMVAADAAFEPQAVWDAMEARGVWAVPAALPPNEPLPLLGCGCCRRVAPARPGTPCGRCGAKLHHRKPASVSRSWALIAAAAIFYVPANLYPVMTVVSLGQGTPHTIVDGVARFIETGFWPLALIVFIASVVVPMLKLVGLSVMLLQIRSGSARALQQRTRLCRLIEMLGRWSMIDVFVVAVLIALVRFGVLASITADIGVACFGAVVVLTMLAAATFDPHLMWDAAETGCSVAERGTVHV